jgi:LuxR family maltose regulon positive regulatory protein
VNGIRTVIRGDVYLSPEITGIVVSKYKELLLKSLLTADLEDTLPILRTKLQRPGLSPDLVPRSDLVARLDELRRRPLTLVSSAAGYGKSTMANQWLEVWDGPYAWLSLDEEENDLRKFINYLLAAIGNAFPGACDPSRSLLEATELPPVSALSRHLVNDLDEIETPFILVLDDFHKIREKTVHDLMGDLLAHPPQNLHLMLLTRRDPPLLTSILRARDQVNEIGTDDLHFTVAETTVFLKNTLGLAVDGKTAATIQEMLEGWPAGMRLMSQALKHSDDLDRLLAGLKGGFATITDYLVTEVLSRQPPEMAKLMAATATLDQFCAPLCDALHELDAGSDTDKMNGDEFIARLRMDNLFLIALDTEHRWFRYHQLFQQMLQDRLNQYWNPEEIAALHSRANDWFAENDLIDDAKIHSPTTFRDDGHRTVPETTGLESPSPPHPTTQPPELPASPPVLRSLQSKEGFPSHSAPQPMIEPLTNRELDVLDQLAKRLSNKEIAEKLFISTTTVKGHLQNIYGKLGVSRRREAVEKARKIEII